MTREPGPTVAPASTVLPGRTKLLGPRVEPASIDTGCSRMMRSWNRWVWSTVPRLTDTPRPRCTRSNSGSHQVSHHTPRSIFAPISRAQALNTGEPTASRIRPGTARDSAKVSASSLRHTKELNSGRSPSRKRPMRAHLTSTGMRAASTPAASTTGVAHSSAETMPSRPPPARMYTVVSTKTIARSIHAVTMKGTARRDSTSVRATTRRRRGR